MRAGVRSLLVTFAAIGAVGAVVAHHRLRSLAVLICGLALSLSACRPAPQVTLSAGPPGVAREDSSTLLIAVPLENGGTAAVNSVAVTSIDLQSATRTKPTAFPVQLGDVAAKGRGVVEAAFASRGLTSDQRYLLNVEGTYVANGRSGRFSVSREVSLPPLAPGSAPLHQAQASPDSVRGAPFTHRAITIPAEVNKPGPPTPSGVRRGTLQPTTPVTGPDTAHTTGAARGRRVSWVANDLQFVTNTAFGTTGGLPDDPSGASGASVALNGPGVVLATGNTYGSFSTNGGQTFTQLDPTAIFPNLDGTGKLIDGGLCCDQVVHYSPSVNRFFWLMLFLPGADGSSRLRLASASPEALASSGGTAWTYWDLTSALFGQTGHMFDYPDLSVGDHFLYVSADIWPGLLVARIPLTELRDGVTIHIGYTNPNDNSAYGKHLIQNPLDEIFWAGSPSTSLLRVFSIKEGSNSYSWRDVPINSYPYGSRTSPGPDGTDWLASLFSGGPGGIRLKSLVSDEIWFEWMADRGGGFPQPHIQYVRLNHANLGVVEQSQIWNATLAFGYAAFANANNKVGVALAYGGGGLFGTPAVGIMGDHVVYPPCASTANASRFGDYTTIRQAFPNSGLFSATVYCVGPGPRFDPHYVLFGRSIDVNPPPISAVPGRKRRSLALGS